MSNNYKRDQVRVIVVLAVGVLLVVLGTRVSWPVASPAGKPVASAGPSRPPWSCSQDRCTATTVTPELAARLGAMASPNRGLTLTSADSLAISTLHLVPSLLQLEIDGGNDLIDLSPVAELHQLKTLTISHAHISTLAPLSSLVVEGLDLVNVGGFDSLEPIAKMPAILDLSITARSCPPLSGLAGMHLRSLKVKSPAITTLDGLDRITGLEKVDLENCPLSDMSVLGKLDGTTMFALGWAPLPSTVVLPPHATEVALVAAHINNLSFLKGNTTIRSLSLLSNEIQDLTPLASMTALTELNLDRNPALTNLAPLARLPALESLSISDTPVRSLADLRDLPLKRIALSHTMVNSLAPLTKIKTLKVIDFLPASVPAAEVDAVKAAHPGIRVTRE